MFVVFPLKTSPDSLNYVLLQPGQVLALYYTEERSDNTCVLCRNPSNKLSPRTQELTRTFLLVYI